MGKTPPFFHSGPGPGNNHHEQKRLGWPAPLAGLFDQYQKAGCYARLCLWLSHRELRPELDAIERVQNSS